MFNPFAASTWATTGRPRPSSDPIPFWAWVAARSALRGHNKALSSIPAVAQVATGLVTDQRALAGA